MHSPWPQMFWFSRHSSVSAGGRAGAGRRVGRGALPVYPAPSRTSPPQPEDSDTGARAHGDLRSLYSTLQSWHFLQLPRREPQTLTPGLPHPYFLTSRTSDVLAPLTLPWPQPPQY